MADVGQCPGCGRTKCFAKPDDHLCPSCKEAEPEFKMSIGEVKVSGGDVQSYGVELAECLEDGGLGDGTWQVELIARKVKT